MKANMSKIFTYTHGSSAKWENLSTPVNQSLQKLTHQLFTLKTVDIWLPFEIKASDCLKDLLKQLKSARCLNEVLFFRWEDIKEINECLRLMETGEEDSCVRRIAFMYPKYNTMVDEPLAIGKRMDSLKLEGCEDLQFAREFLKSALGQHLTTLHVESNSLDDTNIPLLRNLINECRRTLKTIHLRLCKMQSEMLAHLSEWRGLESFSMAIATIATAHDVRNLIKILKNNKLTSFTIKGGSLFPNELPHWTTLAVPEQSLRPLKHLSLGGPHTDFYRLIIMHSPTAIDGIGLKSFKCEHFHPDDLSYISHAIGCWENLHTLELSWMHPYSDAVSLQGLFRAIAKCKKLKKLALDHINVTIEDFSIGDIIEMLQQLQELETLSLYNNQLSIKGVT
jgi:hypothetical protein